MLTRKEALSYGLNLAGAFAFGGEKVQEDLLKREGVIAIDGRVDLQKYQMI